jgi:hypothetical protein
VNPESTTRLSLEGSSYSFVVHLRFNFFKENFRYKFYGLDAFMSQLGGATAGISDYFTE